MAKVSTSGMRVALAGFAALMFVVLITATAPAFAETATGRITGVLKDPSGAVMPGGRIEVKSAESGDLRSATTDQQGRYLFDLVPVGRYEISASSAGFMTSLRREIVVSARARDYCQF